MEGKAHLQKDFLSSASSIFDSEDFSCASAPEPTIFGVISKPARKRVCKASFFKDANREVSDVTQ